MTTFSLLGLLSCAQDVSETETVTTPSTTETSQTTSVTTTTSTTTTTSSTTDIFTNTIDCSDVDPIVFNEIVASNRDTFEDEDGNTPDWFELTNLGTSAVILADWTVDNGDGDGWVLPTITLEPDDVYLAFASGEDRSVTTAQWDTRVDWGDIWHYRTAGTPSEWKNLDFDASSWVTGPSGFGRGDGDDATTTAAQTAYLRTTFEVMEDELENISAIALHVDYDDGFIAYINGEEVARVNMGAAGSPVAFGDYTDAGHEAVMYTGGQPEKFLLKDASDLLIAGDNLLAIEVHDGSADSSDLTMIPFLSLGFSTPIPTATVSKHLDMGGDQFAHTDFKLSAKGETLVLLDERGCVADEVETGRLYMDEALGRAIDDPDSWGYFMTPTPNAPNTSEWRPGFAPLPETTAAGGHYPKGVTFEVIPSEATTLTYSLDGSEPGPAHSEYTEPFFLNAASDQAISSTGSYGETLSVTAVVRVRAFEEGLWPSRIVTNTYFLDDEEFSEDLKVFSLVTDPENLWDEETGIYVLGNNYWGGYPYEGANFWQPWERDLHLEIFDGDGSEILRTDGGVRIQGGWSRAFDQKSFRLIARSGYGDSSFDHPFFGEQDLDSFTRLVLRNGGGDNCSGHIIDTLQGRLFRKPDGSRFASMDYSAASPAIVFLNGEYWGFYNLREKQDDDYVVGHHGVDGDNLDRLEYAWSPWETFSVSQGDLEAYDELSSILASGIASEAGYAAFEEQVDTANFQAYIIGEFHAGNWDWGTNNLKFWRERSDEGRWRWMIYDTENWYDAYTDSFSTWAYYSATWLPIADALANQTFQNEFVNRYSDHLNSTLLPANTLPIVEDVEAAMAPAMSEQFSRWCGTPNTAPWRQQVSYVKDVLEDRPYEVRNHMRAYLGLGQTAPLSLEISPAGTGSIALTAITVDEDFQGTYFRSVPVPLTAIPAEGYTFVGWSEPDFGSAESVLVDLSEITSVTAIFEEG
jgi:hypothetical protein